MNDLKKGMRVGEYRLLSLLGEGGFGQVWKAQHRAWADQVVAVKFPNDTLDLSALKREGDLQHRLDHPGVVKCLGMDLENEPPYLLMEFMSGGTLRARLKEDGAIPWEEAARFCVQILEILAAAHEEGIVHRDLKPENVLFDDEGQPRLADFGLGRAIADLETSLMLSAEAGSEVAGTLAYMAPEIRRGEAADASTDIFALGAMLFEMIVGEPPLAAEGLADMAPEVPEALSTIFRRAYVRKDRRYATAGEMLAELRQAMPEILPPEVPEVHPYFQEGSRIAPRRVDARRASPPALPQATAARKLTGAKRAGFFIRLAAFLIDSPLILFSMFCVTPKVFFSSLSGSYRYHSHSDDVALASVVFCFSTLMVYRWFFHALFGATLGQLMLGLRVVRASTGDDVGVFRAGFRALFFVLFFFSCLGLPILSEYRRGIHDLMTGTCVVHSS